MSVDFVQSDETKKKKKERNMESFVINFMKHAFGCNRLFLNRTLAFRIENDFFQQL